MHKYEKIAMWVAIFLIFYLVTMRVSMYVSDKPCRSKGMLAPKDKSHIPCCSGKYNNIGRCT